MMLLLTAIMLIINITVLAFSLYEYIFVCIYLERKKLKTILHRIASFERIMQNNVSEMQLQNELMFHDYFMSR